MVVMMSFSIPIRTFGLPPSASPIFSISQKTSNAISWRRIHPRKSQSLALNGPNLSDFRVQGCPGSVSEKKSMAAVEMINQDLHRFTVIHPLDGVIWGVNVYIHVSCSITVDKFRWMISAMATPTTSFSSQRPVKRYGAMYGSRSTWPTRPTIRHQLKDPLIWAEHHYWIYFPIWISIDIFSKFFDIQVDDVYILWMLNNLDI
jgi:hypothetical protein